MCFAFLVAENRPGCRNALFHGVNGRVSCSPYDRISSPESLDDIMNLPPSCQGYNASTAIALGGSIEWSIYDYQGMILKVNTENYTNTHSETPDLITPSVNISSSDGELYIDWVGSTMKGPNRTFYNCSVLNSDGEICSMAEAEVIIYIPGKPSDTLS